MTTTIDDLDDLVLTRTQKRDATYLRERIRKSNPAIFEQLERGELPSVNEAARMAGIIKPDTPLKQLRRAWRKVDAKDRERFLQEQIEAGAPIFEASIDPALSAGSAADFVGRDGKLTAAAIYRLWDAMIARNVSPADVMAEIGRSRNDYTFREALNRSTKPRPELVEGLLGWLTTTKPVA